MCSFLHLITILRSIPNLLYQLTVFSLPPQIESFIMSVFAKGPAGQMGQLSSKTVHQSLIGTTRTLEAPAMLERELVVLGP